MRSSRLAVLLSLLSTLPVHAAGLSIANIGTASAAAGSTTLAITTTGACPIGNGIIVFSGIISNTGISGVADTVSNVYVAGLSNSLGTAARQRFWLTSPKNNAGLPNGSTIMITYAATLGIKLAASACIAGALSGQLFFDTDSTGTTGTSTAPSLTIANPPLSPAEIIICGYVVVTGAGDTFTNTTGFSPLTQVSNSSTLNWEYKIISDFSQQTCAPTLGTSRVWGAGGRGYLQTQGVRALTGVGQ